MKLLARLISENVAEYRMAAALGLLLVLNVTGILRNVYGLDTAIFITLVAGYKTFYNSISALMERRISADIALCVAVIAAFSAGQYLAAAEAMFIVLVGETLESFAAGRTEAAIERFIEKMPRTARLLRDGAEQEVEASSLVPGDLVIVRAGERLSADGVIDQGASSIDESSITGEPLAALKQIGDEVFSGTLNGNGLLRIRVSRAGDASILARVVQLVKEAKLQKAPVERLADRYAKYFLPALLLAGALTWYFTQDWSRTVAVLIVACPCALILATPTAMVAAIGGLARRGILVRGGAVLQQAAKVDTAVFDKTGTITEGRFEILRIIPVGGRTENELLALAACAEKSSEHCLARVIMREAVERGLTIADASDAHAVPGRGVECIMGGRVLRAGSAAFAGFHQSAVLEAECDHLGATAVFIAVNEELFGGILLRDRLRVGVRNATFEMRNSGIVHQVMLTGDRRKAAEAIAREAGIPDFEAELLPEAKLARVRQMRTEGRTVAMIGDGINDAPALAAAHVGIAVAGAADISAEAAGVVYMGQSLDQLPQLFEVSRRAMRTAWLNIVLFAGVVNLLAVIACATGMLGPMGAALTHQLASFCVMLNSLRLLRARSANEPVWRGWLSTHGRQLRQASYAIALIMLILSGFYSLAPDEIGVIERFGRKVEPLTAPGLHYKWPVDRLTRIQASRVRSVEIGFRSNRTSAAGAEPSSYEWNVQHRAGRFVARAEEALALTGDQNLVELNAAVHYNVIDPETFLFQQLDAEATVRVAAESVIQSIASSTPLDSILTDGRLAVETRAGKELQQRLDRYRAGVRVIAVKLEDVHPSSEVVDAFRDVSAALEEKSRLVNEAEGYRNELVALSRGNAKARVASADGYLTGRVNRASGDSARFDQQQTSYRLAPGPTETRLYLETMEQVLPGKKKMIVDSTGAGRRHLLLLEDGVELNPLAVRAPSEPRP